MINLFPLGKKLTHYKNCLPTPGLTGYLHEHWILYFSRNIGKENNR